MIINWSLSKCHCTFQIQFMLYLFCFQWPIHVFGWSAILCACLIQPGPAAPVQRGRHWSMALVLTPLSQVWSLTLLQGCSLFSWFWGYKRTWSFNEKIYIFSVNLFQYCKGDLCRPACENGGRCMANEKGDWRCYCWPNFSGERCEVNHCTDYCLNGGMCTGSPLGKKLSNSFV